MTSFTQNQGDWSRIDYAIVRDGHGVALFRERRFFEACLERLGREGHDIKRFDCAQWDSKQKLYESITTELRLTYGFNLDALSDALGELKISAPVGLTLAFDSFDKFAARDRYVADNLVEILIETSMLHMLFGTRLVSVFLCEDPTYLPDLPKPRALVDPIQVVGIRPKRRE